MSLSRYSKVASLALIAACSAPPEKDAARKAPAQAVTHFSDHTELFVEFPALVKDRESAFAVHLTHLADFKPVARGTVVVVISGGGEPEERFEATQPTVPGIFRPVAKPASAGERSLDIILIDGGVEDRHRLGAKRVHETIDEAEKASGGEEESGSTISFLKEQQWKTDFALAPVDTRPLRASLTANGSLRARSDGDARVTAPVAGRIAVGANALPRVG